MNVKRYVTLRYVTLFSPNVP